MRYINPRFTYLLTYLLTNKACLSDIRVTNISKSFTHKMAAKTSWRRYGTKLRHCHPVYRLLVSYGVYALDNISRAKSAVNSGPCKS